MTGPACPGADKLTAREAELCSSARLLPIHYLSLKEVMMRDAQVHGHISRFDVSAGVVTRCRLAWVDCVCDLVVCG